MQIISSKNRSAVQENLTRSRGDFSRALRVGDSEAAARVIDELPVKALSLGELYLELIAPALSAIGESWCVGELGVGQEHLATQIALNQLERLRRIFGAEERRSSYRVLVSCVEGEQHVIGARMFADLCLAEGWVVDFLGADMPAAALLDFISSRQPQILALSVTMAGGLESVRGLLGELALLAGAPKVILGGPAVLASAARFPASNPELAVAVDAVAGVDIAVGWHRAERPTTVLKEYLTALVRRVRELRGQKGWTQEQLAQATRVTRVCIVAVEGGKQNVSMDIVVRMANALGITPEGLLSEDGGSLHSIRRGV